MIKEGGNGEKHSIMDGMKVQQEQDGSDKESKRKEIMKEERKKERNKGVEEKMKAKREEDLLHVEDESPRSDLGELVEVEHSRGTRLDE